MTTTISQSAQSTKISLFVDNCATHPHDKSFLQNVIFMNYSPNIKSVMSFHKA